MERDVNVDNSAALVYDQYLTPEFEASAQQIITGNAITNINGLTGPNITIAGGTTGLSFTPSGITITLAGTLVAANGGTGLSTYAQGDLVYASAPTTIARLAKDANATRYLSNTGGSNNPAWAQINLTNGVTGILPNANGGSTKRNVTNTAPTVNDDSSQGYAVTSLWVDTTAPRGYICLDASVGAANWQVLS